MGIRHLGRQRALQLLYALEFAAPGEPFQEVERLFLMADVARRRGWGPFARALAEAAFAQRESLDEAILPFLRKWTMDRLPWIDRLCLRMALCEMRGFPDIPLRVTINEYIELARLFGTDESPQYVNAILDQLAKDFPHKDFQAREGASEAPGHAPGDDEDVDEDEIEDESEDEGAVHDGGGPSPPPASRRIHPSPGVFEDKPE